MTNELTEFFELGGTPRALERAVCEGGEAVRRLANSLGLQVRSLKSLASRWGILNGVETDE